MNMLPPSRIKCSPSATHNPVTVDVGGEKKKRCGKVELISPPKCLKHGVPKLRESLLPWANCLAASAAPNDHK